MNFRKGLLFAGMIVGILLIISPFVGFFLGLWQCFHGFGGLFHFSGTAHPINADIPKDMEYASGFATGWLAFAMSINASNYLVPIGLFITFGSFVLYLSQKNKTPPPLPPTPNETLQNSCD